MTVIHAYTAGNNIRFCNWHQTDHDSIKSNALGILKSMRNTAATNFASSLLSGLYHRQRLCEGSIA